MKDAGLEIRGVTKRYGDRLAVRDLSLDVHRGEVFGFVGSNGAGKTTTMRIVLGVLLADAGEVLWNGQPINFETRRRIGYMPEERGLYPKMRTGEQLTYLAELHGVAPAAAAGAVGRWLERFDLKDRAKDEVQKLSHGNQQRVQLAAALVFEPIMLILDEPFAGLDPEAVDSMSEILHERAAAGVPVVFSSHQLELVERISDRVGIIQRGHLIACGTVVGLLQLTLLGVVALITISRTQVVNVPNVGVVSVAAGLVWFVLGFLFYALIYAAAGSMVSRQEDIGSITGPLSMLIVATYLAFFWVEANPQNPIGVLLSLLPPFSPILMPARIATGDAQGWQVAIAVVLALAAIAGLNRLAARIYANSVMRIGSRVRLAEAWRGRP